MLPYCVLDFLKNAENFTFSNYLMHLNSGFLLVPRRNDGSRKRRTVDE